MNKGVKLSRNTCNKRHTMPKERDLSIPSVDQQIKPCPVGLQTLHVMRFNRYFALAANACIKTPFMLYPFLLKYAVH